jgi:GABA permease
MHNPLRSEADVFRWVVTIGVAAASLIGLTLLTRPVIGLAWAAALLGFGLGLAYRSARGSLPQRISIRRNDDARHRLLVVANQTVEGEALLEEIRNRCRGRNCEVLVVTPALVGSRAALWASDLDEGMELARRRMQLSLTAIEGMGLEARGEIGDSDPNVAIEDALRLFAADEIVISTLPAKQSRWLERRVVERTRAEVDLPVTHVVVDVERLTLAGSLATAEKGDAGPADRK